MRRVSTAPRSGSSGCASNCPTTGAVRVDLHDQLRAHLSLVGAAPARDRRERREPTSRAPHSHRHHASLHADACQAGQGTASGIAAAEFEPSTADKRGRMRFALMGYCAVATLFVVASCQDDAAAPWRLWPTPDSTRLHGIPGTPRVPAAVAWKLRAPTRPPHVRATWSARRIIAACSAAPRVMAARPKQTARQIARCRLEASALTYAGV